MTAPRAVLLDALGTLVELEPPWVHLAQALGAPADEHLVGAVRAEMGYYRDHSHEGRDPDSLAELRARCAAVLSGALGREVPVETMMSAIRFRAFPDAAPALAELRGARAEARLRLELGLSLPEVLERCGLGGALDGVVTSAEAGVRKPDPAILAPALELAGCAPAEALYVGDTPAEDLAAARAAGVRALLIDRAGGARHRLADGHPALSRSVSDSELSPGPDPVRGRRLERPRPAISPGPGDRDGSPAGIGALLVTTVFEVGVVSAFARPRFAGGEAGHPGPARRDAGRNRLRRRRRQGRGPRLPPGTRPKGPLRSPIGMAAAAYLGYIVIALVYSALVHPQQEDVTRDLGLGQGAFGTIAAGVADRDRRPVLGGDLLSRLHLRRPSTPPLVPGRGGPRAG